MTRRLLAAGAAVLVAGLGLTIAHARQARASEANRNQITLLDQSPFVARGQAFHLRVAVTGADAGTRLEVAVYGRLTTRTDFDASLKGKVRGSPDYVLGPDALGSLRADPAGGNDIDIPTTGASGFTPRSDSAVYPVQVRLLDPAGQALGPPLTTYLVYVSAAGGFVKLSVALTVPVHQPPHLEASGAVGRLPRTESTTLAGVAGALSAHPQIPITLAASPQTLDALAGGSAADRATLAGLAGVAGAGDQVLPSTYVSVSLPAMVGAGLGGEVTTQIAAGATALGVDLHRPAPPPDLWAVDGSLDQASLEALVGRGVKELVVPDGDLSALPESETRTTLAQPTLLSTRSGGRLTVMGADDALASHFTNDGDQVLAAHQLLAELALIQLEKPGQTRGVAVMPPSGWQASPTFLTAVLGGLTANPLLAPVTTETLLATVPHAGVSSTTVRTLVTGRPPGPAGPGGHQQSPSFADVTGVRTARAAADAVAAVVPSERAAAAALSRQVLTAESDELGADGRRAATGVVLAALGRLRATITLPAAASITLTARNGGVPITVLSKAPPGAAVRLRLSSQKLTFQPFTPPNGRCSSPRSGVEVCHLTLANEATTLKVPVVARTSGVFALDVTLAAPDGSVALGDSRNTVRSTAFSGVGVVLIVVAGAALAFWWVRNIRHGRRARDLVPPDVDGPELMESTQEAPPPPLPSYASPPTLEDDPVIAEFFASPAPDYPPAPRSGS